MCRSIKPLFNFDPLATPVEISHASEQFVKKFSGISKPSKINELAYIRAVRDITKISQELLFSLKTTAVPKNREVEILKSRERSIKRFGSSKS